MHSSILAKSSTGQGFDRKSNQTSSGGISNGHLVLRERGGFAGRPVGESGWFLLGIAHSSSSVFRMVFRSVSVVVFTRERKGLDMESFEPLTDKMRCWTIPLHPPPCVSLHDLFQETRDSVDAGLFLSPAKISIPQCHHEVYSHTLSLIPRRVIWCAGIFGRRERDRRCSKESNIQFERKILDAGREILTAHCGMRLWRGFRSRYLIYVDLPYLCRL